MLKVTDSHEWVKKSVDSKKARIGLTKKAAGELDQIVFVKLPKVGQTFKSGEEAAVLESVKAAADTYSPLGGKVVAINEKLLLQPELVTSDPYGDGWLYEIEFSSDDEYQALSDHS